MKLQFLLPGLNNLFLFMFLYFFLQVNYYVQSHIQINEYRDCVILVSMKVWNLLEISVVLTSMLFLYLFFWDKYFSLYTLL